MEISIKSCKNCFITCANNEDSDQTAHMCSLIRVFLVRSIDFLGPIDCLVKMEDKDCISNLNSLRAPKRTIAQVKAGIKS